MNKKSGFTLAEVLVTLMIIGVIAAMTIPSLMQSTAKQEYVAGIKKAMSTLNQAVALEYAITGDAPDSTHIDFLTQRMNFVKGDVNGGFYTADGMWYKYNNGVITVDVNGEKGPNKDSDTEGAIWDMFTLEVDEVNHRVMATEGKQAYKAIYDKGSATTQN